MAISFTELEKIFTGDIATDESTLRRYARDASVFEILPKAVVYPRTGADVGALTRFVSTHKSEDPTLSLTARGAGTDMSGGAVSDSIVVDFTRYMNKILSVTPESATAEPGTFYRDFEKATLANGTLMPSFPASRELCTIGGMVSNNSGGEKTLRYGQTRNFITKLKVVFRDGNEYVVHPLTLEELTQKIESGGFEGELYRSLKELIDTNEALIQSARPGVSKNAAGYYLWDVYDPKTRRFDLCQLIAGSQGTLGFVTEITFRLVPQNTHSNILAVFMPDLSKLSEIVNDALPFEPETMETFDDYSLKLALRFFFDFWGQMGLVGMLQLGWQFIPEALMVMRGGKLPKLILIIECAGTSEESVHSKLVQMEEKLRRFGYPIRIAGSQNEAEKYWRVRHESFNLLRKHVRGLRTAPFIEDVAVAPEHLPTFLPRLETLLREYKLIFTIAGHAGNGNFHIIPLMDFTRPDTEKIILELSDKVYALVAEYGGTITAEHNDGLIRTPYLSEMFGEPMYALFGSVKKLFDPEGILNPKKKTGASKADIKQYLAKS